METVLGYLTRAAGWIALNILRIVFVWTTIYVGCQALRWLLHDLAVNGI
jgi:hypothetical protein